jgi:L-ascorbate metabolism protein UlaG (beta-lactamase superfamily)
MKPAHHHPDGGFANNSAGVRIGNFPWHEMVWRTARGHFKPQSEPEGGYAQFARAWSAPVDHARLEAPGAAPQVTWLGHVSILLQLAGRNVLFDPTLAAFAGPYGRLGAARRVPAPLQAHELPRIDAVMISHNHYDHLCDATLAALHAAGQRPHYYVPLGLKDWFVARGLDRVTEMDWWDRVVLADSELAVHFTPSQHWSRRTPWDTNASLWGGFMVQWQRGGLGDWRFHFPGDTGYCDDFKQIHARLGPVDLLALPIGAYLPRDFMKPMHVNPDDAIQLMLDLEAKQAFGVHWGTFMLTQESFDQPPKDLARALRARGLAQDRVWLLKTGETRSA